MNDQGVAQAGLGQGRRGELGVLSGDFDAQKIDVRPGGGGVAQEKPLARTDFDLQRRRASEQRRGVPRPRQLVEGLQMAGQVDRGIDFSQCAAAHENKDEDEG